MALCFPPNNFGSRVERKFWLGPYKTYWSLLAYKKSLLAYKPTTVMMLSLLMLE